MTIAALSENRHYYAAKTATTAYLGFALYLSFDHITGLFTRLGSHTPYAGFLLIDSMILIGRMLRSPKQAKSTRRVGTTLQYFGAACSLAANVLAADNDGDRVLGVMVITLMLIIEAVADRIRPPRSAATAQKAAATRRANLAAKREQEALKAEKRAAAAERARLTRERKRLEAEVAATELTVKDMQVAFDASTAPVSPAPAASQRTEPGYL